MTMYDTAHESSMPAEPGTVRSSLNFPVVGIGASAGGLTVLVQLFENMPAAHGMAFVVILHLSPKHPSSADAILQRATRMPVVVEMPQKLMDLWNTAEFRGVRLGYRRACHHTHRLDYDQLAEDAGSTFDTLRPVEREVRSNDGRYYVVRLLPYRTNEDRIEGAVMTFFDITARREAEEQARASEERMRMVAESADDYAIITLDEDGRITGWNKGAQHLFRYSAEEMQGQVTDRLFVPEDISAGFPADELRRARDDGRAEDERWDQRKDGSRVFCSGVTTPLRNGSFHGYAKIARDATRRERRGLEREQASSEREAVARADAVIRNSAMSAAERLAILEREPVDLLISDISMPEIDGHEFLRRVRANPKLAALPAIAISSLRSDGDVSKARAAGFSAHLGKPMSVERLGAIVHDLLPRRQRSPAA